MAGRRFTDRRRTATVALRDEVPMAALTLRPADTGTETQG